MEKRTINYLKWAGIILGSLFVLVSIIPYLIPLSETNPMRSIVELESPEGKYFELGEKNIYYEDYNPEGKKGVILLVHGFGGSTFTFRHNINNLTDQDYRVIAVDLLGYGLSSKDYDSDYSHPTQANRIELLMEQLGIDHAIMVGHSMGGSIVTHFAHRYPERVEKLILVAPAIDTENSEPRLDSARIASRLLIYPPFQRIARLVLRGYFFPDRVNLILETAYYNPEILEQKLYDGYADRIVTGDWDLSILASSRDYPYNIITFPLTDIDKDVLIIAGQEDKWVPLIEAEQLQSEFGNAQLEVIPEAGHLLLEEKPEEFNQIVNDFLAEQ